MHHLPEKVIRHNKPNILEPVTNSLCSQASRYLLVGLTTNLIGYLIYIILTYWLAPILAITILYPISLLVSFLGNRNFTFSSKKKINLIGIRYLFAQFLGYLLNVLIQKILVDYYNLPHQIVQIISIFIVAAFLFVLLRYIVFGSENTCEVGS